jgi:hypothetical protein
MRPGNGSRPRSRRSCRTARCPRVIQPKDVTSGHDLHDIPHAPSSASRPPHRRSLIHDLGGLILPEQLHKPQITPCCELQSWIKCSSLMGGAKQCAQLAVHVVRDFHYIVLRSVGSCLRYAVRTLGGQLRHGKKVTLPWTLEEVRLTFWNVETTFQRYESEIRNLSKFVPPCGHSIANGGDASIA